jgi:hypothetical protein
MTGAMPGKVAIEVTSHPALAGDIFPGEDWTPRGWRDVADGVQETGEQRLATTDAGASRRLCFRLLLPASRTNTTGRRRVGARRDRRRQPGAARDERRRTGKKIVRILGELSLDIATPDEASRTLALKGAEETALL